MYYLRIDGEAQAERFADAGAASDAATAARLVFPGAGRVQLHVAPVVTA